MKGVAPLLAALLCAAGARAQEETLEPAIRSVARWLEGAAIAQPGGLAWPRVPGASSRPDASLYAGTAGVVLFFLEAWYLDGREGDLKIARRGADSLLAGLPSELGPGAAGLYSGIAGIGFALGETWRASQEPIYRRGALRCVALLGAAARERPGGGIAWGACNDIISGSAGIGLFLLQAAKVLEERPALDLARRAGLGLLGAARRAKSGWWWPMTPDYPREMPNFSHGTAGVATFLAALYERCAEKRFLEGARAGARYLVHLAGASAKGFQLCHHRPGGEKLFYLGWCHGPVGTARLFRALHEITGEERWRTLFFACAETLMRQARPGAHLPGLWNNVGQCCGTAGIAEFLLAVHRLGGAARYLERAGALTRDLLARGTRDEKGLRWVQAEHRVRPELLEAQCGYMQGAAGIGMWLAHLEAQRRGRRGRIRLPDDPF